MNIAKCLFLFPASQTDLTIGAIEIQIFGDRNIWIKKILVEMKRNLNWFIFQLVLSLMVVIIHIFLFNFLVTCEQKYESYFKKRWKTICISLSLCHMLTATCLVVLCALRLLVSGYLMPREAMDTAEVYVFASSSLCSMFHVITVMVNDIRYLLHNSTIPEENLFYIVVSWAATFTSACLLGFAESQHQVLYILAVIALAMSILLFFAYIEISRRIIIQLKRSDEFGEESTTEELPTTWSRHFVYMGVLLAVSFVIFTIPYALERLLWHQNNIISMMCVGLNAVSQGMIMIIRIQLNEAVTNFCVSFILIGTE